MSKFPSQSSENPACDCQNNFYSSLNISSDRQYEDHEVDDQVMEEICDACEHETSDSYDYQSGTMEPPMDSNIRGDKWDIVPCDGEEENAQSFMMATISEPCSPTGDGCCRGDDSLTGEKIGGIENEMTTASLMDRVCETPSEQSVFDPYELDEETAVRVEIGEVEERLAESEAEEQSRQTRDGLRASIRASRSLMNYMKHVLSQSLTERHDGPLSVRHGELDVKADDRRGEIGSTLIKVPPYVYVLSGGPRITHGSRIRRGDKVLCVAEGMYCVGQVMNADIKYALGEFMRSERDAQGSIMMRVCFEYTPESVAFMPICDYTVCGYTPITTVGEVLVSRDTWPELVDGQFELMMK